MRKFARVQDGLIFEFFDAAEGDIYEYFHRDMVWVDVDDHPGVQVGWGAYEVDGAWSFRPVDAPVKDNAERLTEAKAHQSMLMNAASQAMTPLLVSLQLGDATAAETARARLWQSYCRALMAVDLSSDSPEWPDLPE